MYKTNEVSTSLDYFDLFYIPCSLQSVAAVPGLKAYWLVNSRTGLPDSISPLPLAKITPWLILSIGKGFAQKEISQRIGFP